MDDDRRDDPLPATLASGLDEFLVALRVEAALARNTLRAYRGDVERFLRWALARRALAGWSDVDAELVIDWLGELRARGRAEASVARALSALRMCLRHLVAENVIERDPLTLVSAPVLRRALPHALSVHDVDALLAAPAAEAARARTPPPAWRVERDVALLEVLYACGARVSEAVGLRTDGLEPSLRVVVLHGKGSKTRLVPLGARARAALERWIEHGRRTLPGHERRPEVFLSRRGRPLDRRGAWRRVKVAARAAGLPDTVSPHTLRHSFASHLIEAGADLRSVQEMLGHASIRTTEVYTHLDAEEVRSLHRLYHPRG